MTQITGNINANRISTTFAVNAGDNFALPVPTNNLQVLALGGADTIDTGAGLVSNSTFQGGSGNDSIAIGLGGAVSSTFFGGEGNDIITVAGALTSSAIQSLTGNNRVTTAVANLAFIRTDVGSDTINLGQGNALTQFSTVRAGDGADSININGGVNNSTIFAGNGNDTINIDGALANTLVQTLTGNNTIGGTALGTLNASSIQTGSGADTIILAGALTNSVIRAGAANDSIRLTGAMTNSSIFAGEGNDTISLLGNAVRTGSSFTSITGDNRFVFDADVADNGATINNNTFTGGSGNDRLVFTATANATNFFTNNNFTNINTVEVAGGVLTTGGAISARGINNVVLTGINGTGIVATGSVNALTIAGNNNANDITGGLGNDTINAGGGTNTISGVGNGLDVIIHNTTNQSSANVTGITVTAVSQVTLTASVLGASLASGDIGAFVNASTSTAAVSLTGGTGTASTLIGGSGNDILIGGTGADSLIGGNGDDTITGGAGADRMTGGGGADDFIMTNIVAAGANANEGTIGLDIITDFTVAGTDQIGNYGAVNIEQLAIVTDLVFAGAGTSIAAGALGATITNITGAFDLGTANTGSILSVGSATAFTPGTLGTAFTVGGALALTANGERLAADGFLVVYDNNVDSFVAVVTNAATIADNATGTFVVTNLTTLSGVADASTLTNANLLNFT